MIDALTTHHNRKLSVVFLAICFASACAAGVIGIDDNALGILCAFGASAALVLTFVHPWRGPKQYGLLLLGAVLCFVVAGILHNVFHGVAGDIESALVQKVLEGFGVVAFLLAVLVCPPAAIVGLVGSVTMIIRKHYRPRHA